jgi:uncharacterized membrane protein required for colicin V production
MPTLNIADLSLAIVWLFFGIRGYLRGLVKEAGSLAAIVLGFYCAGAYHKALAPHLTDYISGNYAGTAAYLLIFTVTLLAVWFLALAVSGMVKITMTQWADRFFGGFFGVGKGVVLTAALLFLIHLASPNPDFLKGSLLVPVLDKVSGRLAHYIPPDINEKLRKFGRKDVVDPVKAAVEKKIMPDKKPAEPEKKPEPEKKAEAEKKSENGKPSADKAKGGEEKKAPEKKAKAEPAKERHDNASGEKPKAASTDKTAGKAENTEKKP